MNDLENLYPKVITKLLADMYVICTGDERNAKRFKRTTIE